MKYDRILCEHSNYAETDTPETDAPEIWACLSTIDLIEFAAPGVRIATASVAKMDCILCCRYERVHKTSGLETGPALLQSEA